MPIRIDKDCEVPLHEQIRQQVIFGIATGEYPVGHEMESLSQVANREDIHRNTVWKAYKELADKRWLVRQQGTKFVVVHPRGSLPDPKTENIDTLIVRLLMAARAQDLSSAELVKRIQESATDELPDHFLIVEPEPGLGAMLKYEVQKVTGRRVVSHSIQELWQCPQLLKGAALLVPAYLADLLDFLPLQQQASMTRLVYAPLAGFVGYVRNLREPSIIGMLSVTGPGMKTMDGVFAESIGSKHTLIPLLLEWPLHGDKRIVIRKLSRGDLPPDVDIRVLGMKSAAARKAILAVPPPPNWAAHLPIATVADLRAIDVLFTDSITSNFVRHPQRIKYHLLSEESLQEIAAVKLAEAR